MFGRKNSYWQHVNPIGAIADFREVVRQAGHNKYRIGIAAAAVTIFLFWSLTHETWLVPQPKPQVIYINSWYKDRTAEQTRAFIEKNQKLKDEIKAAQDERDEKVKQVYRTIGKASGMDVEAIEKKAKEEAAAEVQRKAALQVAPVAK